jgi:hypothetical protein
LVDPFTIQDAETIIAAAHRMHGEWYGNYEEFRLFTGLRQSEQFALQVDDCNLVDGKINVTKAVVVEQMKNRTKTNKDREITLCPRAAWTKGSKPEDVELIKKSMSVRPNNYDGGDDNDRRHRRRFRHKPLRSPEAATSVEEDDAACQGTSRPEGMPT